MAQANDFQEYDPYASSSNTNAYGQLDDLFRSVNTAQAPTAAQQSSNGYSVPTPPQGSSSAPPIYASQPGSPFTNWQGQSGTVPTPPSGPNGPISSVDQGMWKDLWAKSGQNPQAFTQGVIGQLGLRGHQADPTALNTIARAFQSVGKNATLDPRTDAYHKGLMIDGQFVKMLDGSDNWIYQPGGGSSGGDTSGVAASGFTDPASQMFQQMVLDRIAQLQQTINRPEQDAYRKAALARVDQLQQAPYTAADEQALITHMREPLTQARDARMAQAKDQMGARNMLPTSGLYQDQVFNAPNRDYERALAGGTNDLAVQAINEKSTRNNQALDILSNLVGLGQNNRNENNMQADKALTTGAILPDMTERRLQLLMQSLGMGQGDTSSLMSTLTALNGQNQNAAQFQAGQQNNNAAAIGQLIGQLIGSPLLNPTTWRG